MHTEGMLLCKIRKVAAFIPSFVNDMVPLERILVCDEVAVTLYELRFVRVVVALLRLKGSTDLDPFLSAQRRQ